MAGRDTKTRARNVYARHHALRPSSRRRLQLRARPPTEPSMPRSRPSTSPPSTRRAAARVDSPPSSSAASSPPHAGPFSARRASGSSPPGGRAARSTIKAIPQSPARSPLSTRICTRIEPTLGETPLADIQRREVRSPPSATARSGVRLQLSSDPLAHRHDGGEWSRRPRVERSTTPSSEGCGAFLRDGSLGRASSLHTRDFEDGVAFSTEQMAKTPAHRLLRSPGTRLVTSSASSLSPSRRRGACGPSPAAAPPRLRRSLTCSATAPLDQGCSMDMSAGYENASPAAAARDEGFCPEVVFDPFT